MQGVWTLVYASSAAWYPNFSTCMLAPQHCSDSEIALFQGAGTTGGGGGGVPAEFSVRQGRVPHTINEGRIKTVQGSSVAGLLLA